MSVHRSVASHRVPVAGAPEALRAAGPTRARRVMAWLVQSPAVVLGAMVGLSAFIRAWISIGAVSPWVLPDELVYSDLARSIADGHRPAVRGVPVFGWGEVYPTVIAPIWALVDDRYVAYHATLVANAIVMSLAAVPAYFLARLFVSHGPSLLVAALTVLVPSLSYTGVVLTENAFYPLFLLALLVIARAVRRPTVGTQALALVALGLVAFTRIQGVALLAGYAGAVLTYALTTSRPDRLPYLRRFVPTVLVAVPVALGPVIASVARGDGVFGWLGQRSGTFDEFRAQEVPQWVGFLAAGLVLYVAVVPAVATAVMVGLGLSPGEDDAVRLFAAVALPTLVAMLLSVAFVSASFDVDGIGNLNERYVFHVVPLTFVGLALWIERGIPRPRPWAWVTLGLACLAPALLPIDRLDYNAGLQALALLPWGALSLSPWSAILVGVVTLGCGVLWSTCGPRSTGRLWALVGVWMALLGLFAVESNRVSASRTAAAFAGLVGYLGRRCSSRGRGRRRGLGREPGAEGVAGLLLLLADGHRVLQPERRRRPSARSRHPLRGVLADGACWGWVGPDVDGQPRAGSHRGVRTSDMPNADRGASRGSGPARSSSARARRRAAPTLGYCRLHALSAVVVGRQPGRARTTIVLLLKTIRVPGSFPSPRRWATSSTTTTL